jgi:hypothetical protein
MDIVLRELKAFCLVYIDDIIIFSRTFEVLQQNGARPAHRRVLSEAS